MTSLCRLDIDHVCLGFGLGISALSCITGVQEVVSLRCNVGGVFPGAQDDAEGYGHDKDGTRTFFKASKEEGGRRKGGPGASIANTVDGAVEPGAPGHSETKSEEIEIHHFAQAVSVDFVRPIGALSLGLHE